MLATRAFVRRKEESSKKYVGVPAMNAISTAMCHELGVEAKFGIVVGKSEWLEDKKPWLLIDLDGQTLGEFDVVVVSDIYVVYPRFTAVTGRPPPLDMNLVPELAPKLQEAPALPYFNLMLAFSEPLSLPVSLDDESFDEAWDDEQRLEELELRFYEGFDGDVEYA